MSAATCDSPSKRTCLENERGTGGAGSQDVLLKRLQDVVSERQNQWQWMAHRPTVCLTFIILKLKKPCVKQWVYLFCFKRFTSCWKSLCSWIFQTQLLIEAQGCQVWPPCPCQTGKLGVLQLSGMQLNHCKTVRQLSYTLFYCTCQIKLFCCLCFIFSQVLMNYTIKHCSVVKKKQKTITL